MERSNRKRALDGGGGGASAKSPPPPPRKQAKVSFGDRDGREDRVNGAVGSAECQGHDVAERARSGRSDEVGRSRQVLDEYVKVESDVREDAGSGGAVGIFQRSQLAAKIGEQARELAWARGKIGEMEAVVTELDSAPMHAGYSLAAANEDMTVCLGQVGGTSEPAVVASTVLETDVSLAALESEAEKLRRLTKAVVQVVRAKLEIPAGVGEDSASVSGDGDASESVKDLHDRLRVAGDQLERYEARGREATLATDNLRDEMDDIRMLVDIRRRKIVRLELALREGRESLEESIRGAVANAVGREVGRENGGATGPGQGADNVVDQGGEDGRRRSSAVMCDKKSGEVDVGVGRSNSSGEDPAGQIPQLEKLAAQRLEELEAMQKEKIEVHLELSILQREVESRKAGILSEADVASCPIFKALEVELLQVSKMKITLEEDEKVMAEERAKERADAYSKHESVKVEAERSADESRKLVDDLRRVAESAKAEKDRWVMTYEARKMEANAAAGLVDACEKRAFVCEGMREKLKKTNVEMSEEVEDLRRRVREAELRAIGGAGSDELVSFIFFEGVGWEGGVCEGGLEGGCSTPMGRGHATDSISNVPEFSSHTALPWMYSACSDICFVPGFVLSFSFSSRVRSSWRTGWKQTSPRRGISVRGSSRRLRAFQLCLVILRLKMPGW